MPDSTTPDAATPSGAINRDALRGVASLWWVLLLRGVLMIAVGGYALLTPGVTVAAYAWVLGVFVLIDGVLAIIAGVMGWVESRWWAVARGLLGIVAGLFVIAHPALVGAIAATTLVILLAVQSILGGVFEIAAAIRERKQIEGEWWLVLGGLLSVVFGGILLSQPLLGGVLLIQVLGVFAIIAGVALIVAALRLRRFGKRFDEA